MVEAKVHNCGHKEAIRFSTWGTSDYVELIKGGFKKALEDSHSIRWARIDSKLTGRYSFDHFMLVICPICNVFQLTLDRKEKPII